MAILTGATIDDEARKLADSLGLTIAATRKGDRCPPGGHMAGRCPDGLLACRAQASPFSCSSCHVVHGDRYRVTLRIGRLDSMDRAHWSSLSFDYWPADAQAARPTYTTIIRYVNGLSAPEAGVTAHALDARVRRFFTDAEVAALQEGSVMIQGVVRRDAHDWTGHPPACARCCAGRDSDAAVRGCPGHAVILRAAVGGSSLLRWVAFSPTPDAVRVSGSPAVVVELAAPLEDVEVAARRALLNAHFHPLDYEISASGVVVYGRRER